MSGGRVIEADRSPHVLLVSSTLEDDGGIPVCVAQLAAALAGLGVEVDITGQCAGPLGRVIADAARHAGVGLEAVREPWHARGQWRAAKRVAAIVREKAGYARRHGRPLVVHLHGVWVAPVLGAAAAARDAGARVVFSPHGMLREEALRKSRLKKRMVWEGWLRRALASADTLHVTSPHEGDDLMRLLPGCRPTLVPLGVVPPADAPRPWTAGQPRRAGYLGRILPIKNLDVLIAAWARVRPEGWRLSLVGPDGGGTAALLRQQSVALGIGHEVDIAGPVPNDRLGEHFAGLDLFVLPSRSEAFALTVGEALSSGVPAIVTTAAPWGDVVVKGCGWSVAPSLEGLAKGLEEATALPPDVLRSMGQRGREWVRGAFSWEAVARRHLIELYGCPPGLAAEDAGGHVDCRPADPPSRWGV